MTTPEQDLWVAVIAQQFTDACRETPIKYYYEVDGNGHRHKKEVKHRVPWANDVKLARTWLETPSQDFNTVCHLAGVDPAWVRREWDDIKTGKKKRTKWTKNR
jgi:hypothetical protein